MKVFLNHKHKKYWLKPFLLFFVCLYICLFVYNLLLRLISDIVYNLSLRLISDIFHTCNWPIKTHRKNDKKLYSEHDYQL